MIRKMQQTLKFLRQLAANNNREWFAAHKSEYLEVKASVEKLTNSLIALMLPFEPDAARLSPADCTYRIYRDTRFSADKTPYKTHIGIFINPPLGKKTNRMGYYLHIEPGNSFVSAGTIGLPSPTITAVRRAIADNIDEYLCIVDNPAFKSFFPSTGVNPLKTAPKGFPKDWPYIDLVRPREFFLQHPISDCDMCADDMPRFVSEAFRLAKPWCDFHNFTIDECTQ